MSDDRALTIVHVSTQRGWHGGEEQAHQLMVGLMKRGHRCVVHARKDGEFVARMRRLRMEVHPFSGRGRNPLTIAHLRRFWRELKPDVIHFHDSHALSGTGFAAWKTGIRARVASRRINFPVKSPWIYRHLCDRVIAVSNTVAEVCMSSGVPKDRLRTVYDGVDPARIENADRSAGRQALAATEDDFIILTVASLNELKGHRYLLQALPQILKQHPAVKLALVGDGPLRQELQRQASELGIDQRVQFFGYRTDVPQLMKAADLFVLPSHTEGLGSSLIDAMFAGTPIVATRAGGIPEAVGECGLLVPPRDAIALAAAIDKMVSSPDLRAELAGAARRRALSMFTADSMVEQTLQAYRELLSAI